MINQEGHNKQVKTCSNKTSILRTIISIYIMYELCIQIVYIMFMIYTFCSSELMYTICIQNVCIQNVSHILTNFFIHFIYKIQLAQLFWLLYTKCIQNFVKIWDTFCIHQLYTSCTSFVCKMYAQFPFDSSSSIESVNCFTGCIIF